MRIAFTTLPGVSHLVPMVPLAHALQARGHEVVVISAGSFAATIARCGLTPHAVGTDYALGTEETFVPALREARIRRDADFRYTEVVLVDHIAAGALPDVLRFFEAWRPDVVIRDPVDFAAFTAAEALAIPHVTGRENRFLSPKGWRREVGGSLQRLAASIGLDLPDPSSLLYRNLGIAPVLPSFIAATPRAARTREFSDHLPNRLLFTRPEPFDGALPADRNAPAEAPDVLITLGTVFNNRPAVLRSITDALLASPLRSLVVTGPGLTPGDDGGPRLPTVASAPLVHLMQGCRAVVTAGGLGTVSAAMTVGRPMVLLPHNADQPLNAARCEALGIGVAIGEGLLTAQRIAAAVSIVIDDPSFRRSFVPLQRERAGLPGPAEVARAVEAVARA